VLRKRAPEKSASGNFAGFANTSGSGAGDPSGPADWPLPTFNKNKAFLELQSTR
jgi:hypothetical protein